MLITALLHVILHFAVQLQVLVSQQFANLPSAWQLATALGVDRALYDLDTRMHSALDNIWLRPTRTIAYLDDFEWHIQDDVARIIAPDSANVVFTDTYGYFFDTYDAAKSRSGTPARGGRPRKSDVHAVLLLYMLAMATGIALSATRRINKIPTDTGNNFERPTVTLRLSASVSVASSPAVAGFVFQDGVPEAGPVPEIINDVQHTECASSPVPGVDITLPASPSPSTVGPYEEEEDAQFISDPLRVATSPEDDAVHDEDVTLGQASQDDEQQTAVPESPVARLVATLSPGDQAVVQPFLSLLDNAPSFDIWIPEPVPSAARSQSDDDYYWDDVSSAPMGNRKDEVLQHHPLSVDLELLDTDLDMDLQSPVVPDAGAITGNCAVDPEYRSSPLVGVDVPLPPSPSELHCEKSDVTLDSLPAITMCEDDVVYALAYDSENDELSSSESESEDLDISESIPASLDAAGSDAEAPTTTEGLSRDIHVESPGTASKGKQNAAADITPGIIEDERRDSPPKKNKNKNKNKNRNRNKNKNKKNKKGKQPETVASAVDVDSERVKKGKLPVRVAFADPAAASTSTSSVMDDTQLHTRSPLASNPTAASGSTVRIIEVATKTTRGTRQIQIQPENGPKIRRVAVVSATVPTVPVPAPGTQLQRASTRMSTGPGAVEGVSAAVPTSGTQLQASARMSTGPGAVELEGVSLPRPTATGRTQPPPVAADRSLARRSEYPNATRRTPLPVVGSSTGHGPSVPSRSPTPVLTPENDAQPEGGRARGTTVARSSIGGHGDSPHVPSRSPTPVLTPEDDAQPEGVRARGTTLRVTVSESNVEAERRELETLVNLQVATNVPVRASRSLVLART